MNKHEFEALKETNTDKASQGDVNIYQFATRPNIETTATDDEDKKTFALKIGQQGNAHTVKGFRAIGKATGGYEKDCFLVEAGDYGCEFSHPQHVPPIRRPGPFFLIDFAQEIGMLTDMKEPVAD